MTKSTPTRDGFVCRELTFSRVCTLLADVASTEQQQSAKDPGKAWEEEETEDASAGMGEQEELCAVNTEQLESQEARSGRTAGPGESCSEHTLLPKLSDSQKPFLWCCSRAWSLLSPS